MVGGAVQVGVPAKFLHEMGAPSAGKPEPHDAVVGGYPGIERDPQSSATRRACRNHCRVERQRRGDPDGVQRTPRVNHPARVFDAVRCGASRQTMHPHHNAQIVELEPAGALRVNLS
jgi:hypothetical protein